MAALDIIIAETSSETSPLLLFIFHLLHPQLTIKLGIAAFLEINLMKRAQTCRPGISARLDMQAAGH